MTTYVSCPKRGNPEWVWNLQTGEYTHWIDVYFLGPIRRQLEERKITFDNVGRMTDDDILLISRGDPPFMTRLFRLRHRFDIYCEKQDFECEQDFEDFQEQEDFNDERILAFLRRHD